MSHTSEINEQATGSVDLRPVFLPRTIAVIGASPDRKKIGNKILRNIIEGGFTGKIFPINPSAQEVEGIQAYPSIAEVPDEIDLAMIAIPAAHVAQALRQCGEKKVASAAVITSGFAEIGRIDAENELARIAKKYNIILLGPNMFGVVYTPHNLNASFGPQVGTKGRIAFISQSGALGIAMMGWTEMERIGLASVVSLGNKAQIDDTQLIKYFNDDQHVDTILIYMEGIRNAREFMKTEIKKPVVALKVGRSSRGAKAAASHTGSLSGSDRIYDGAFKQLGILRADSFTDGFAWSRTLLLPGPKGKQIVIITNGGGIGVRTTDEVEKAGLKLLDEPAWLEEHFRPTMPDYGSTKNPVDITGSAGYDEYSKAMRIAFAEDRIHSIVVLYCETAITDPSEIAKAIIKEYHDAGAKKPVVVAMMGGDKTRKAIHLLNGQHIPSFVSVSEAVSGLKALYEWREISARPREILTPQDVPDAVKDKIASLRAQNRTILMEHEAREILQLCGITVPGWGFAQNLDEAIEKAKGLYPLAMKIASPDIVHKTEVSGVMLNIQDEEDLAIKFKKMMSHVQSVKPDARIMGVNLVQMVKGIELIAGLHQDPQFGPCAMFGLGGVFVELLKDVSFRVVPFGRMEAERMINDIQGRDVLDGFRGYRSHRESILQTLLAIQKLAPYVKELDINPLISNEENSYAADARIIL